MPGWAAVAESFIRGYHHALPNPEAKNMARMAAHSLALVCKSENFSALYASLSMSASICKLMRMVMPTECVEEGKARWRLHAAHPSERTTWLAERAHIIFYTMRFVPLMIEAIHALINLHAKMNKIPATVSSSSDLGSNTSCQVGSGSTGTCSRENHNPAVTSQSSSSEMCVSTSRSTSSNIPSSKSSSRESSNTGIAGSTQQFNTENTVVSSQARHGNVASAEPCLSNKPVRHAHQRMSTKLDLKPQNTCMLTGPAALPDRNILQQLTANMFLTLTQMTRLLSEDMTAFNALQRAPEVLQACGAMEWAGLRNTVTNMLTPKAHCISTREFHEMWERYGVTHFHGRLTSGCCNLECINLAGVSESALQTKLCSGCRRARYCCVECQKAAWIKGGHRSVCRE